MSVFRPIKAIKDSKLYSRLVALEETERAESAHEDGEVAKLMLNVKALVKNAEIISEHVITHMPQYTLHNGRHLWNVLSYTEELAGESIEEFSALECALLIMAVFVHDLGMVPDAEEVRAWEDSNAKTPEAEAWQTYCAGHPLWTQREKLPVEKETEKLQLLGKVRADYLRETHADEAKPLGGLNRINRWLERLEGFDPKLLEHRGLSYREPLALLAMSHGQSVDWLPERLTTCKEVSLEKKEDVYHHDVGGEHVNWPYLSWLLRLADIMDFDASRTPAVVFEHLGIEDAVSVKEWQKHLSIASVSFLTDAEGAKVRYVCNKCPSPRVEKAIHEFIGWINLELGHVATEQARGSRHYESRKETLQLNLPDKAEVKINAREGSYEYLDVSFTLERDAVMELLMGEALYGDHNLALRELVQNALDALHLRDMRSQLRDKLREAGRINDAPPVEPVGASEKLEVQVTWGHDAHGRAWIKVKDNGVGMTKGQIEKFLTRIGKSYYKSPEFKREQKLMKEHGLLCTTISQFGIGFLSSFMLADKVEVVTRAGGRGGDDDHARRVVVDGPHGMIAIYPVAGNGGGVVTGTEVTLWLKEEFQFVPWDRAAVIRDLKHRHYGGGHEGDLREVPEKSLDPALELGMHVVWPLYPVRVGRLAAKEPLVLDEDFHFRELMPLAVDAVWAKANDWDVESGDLSRLAWDPATWQDEQGSGSRVRYAVPRIGSASGNFAEWVQRPNVVPGILAQTLLQAFVEPQFSEKGRTRILVNGIAVPETGGLGNQLAVVNGVGGCCWVDLRGVAAPRLRSDRQGVTRFQPAEGQEARELLYQRSTNALQPVTMDSWRWLSHALAAKIPRPEKDGAEESWLHAIGLTPDPVLWCLGLYAERRRESGFVHDHAHIRAFACDLARGRDSVGSLIGVLPRARDCAQVLAPDLVADIDHALGIARVRALALARALAHTRDRASARSRVDRASALARDLLQVYVPVQAFDHFVGTSSLSGAFLPTAEDGLPALSTSGVNRRLMGLSLVGPVELSPQHRPLPDWLTDWGYDLIAPWTGLPHGWLRERCPSWEVRRNTRVLFILPFLYGHSFFSKNKGQRIVSLLGVPNLLLWMPHPKQMGWRFDDPEHSQEEWSEGCLSALWDVEQDTVVYAPGLHDRESIRKVGVSLDVFLEIGRE